MTEVVPKAFPRGYSSPPIVPSSEWRVEIEDYPYYHDHSITHLIDHGNTSGVENTIDEGRYAFSSPDQSDRTIFTFDSAGDLLSFQCEIANIDEGATSETLFSNTAAQIAAAANPAAVPATCSIVKNAPQCVDQTKNVLFVCSNALELQIGALMPPPNSTTYRTCSAITPTPVYM